ncbi:MAG: P-II family nitrogen regulator [Capsulimonadaceae bacterium]
MRVALAFILPRTRWAAAGYKEYGMKKIESIIRPLRLESVKSALAEAGVTGMTVSDVRGCGRHDDRIPGVFRGAQFVIHLPQKVKLEIVVRDEEVDEVVEILLLHAHTGVEGDGKIFVLPANGALRIRTGETGDFVL